MARPENIPCSVCGFRAEGIFCCVESSLLDKVDRGKTVHEYQRGHGIFYEGSPAFAMYCIRSGRVKLFKTGSDGALLLIRVAGAGETIGYRAVLANEPFEATAEAVEPTTVCAIPRQTLIELLRHSPDLALKLLAKLSQDLRALEDRTMRLMQEPVRRRTADLLLTLSELRGSPPRGDGRIMLPVRRKEMAQMIGTTPETLSRTLHSFARQGILTLTRVEICIRDVEALRKAASLA